MISCGYAGKILRVDLTTEEITEEPTGKYSDWIGGRGMGLFLISQAPELFSDDPAVQPIALSAGPLVGTGVPLGVRTSVSGRNQISGGISYSNVGGDFGICMRGAGYDSVLVQGASLKPVYLLLKDSGAELLPADDLWGLQISPLQRALFERHGREQMSFIGIGPAGEREAAISCLIVDQAHAAGWGSSGLLFGAKKLKAVVAVGRKPVVVFDPVGLKRKAKQLAWRIKSSDAAAGLVRGGTHGMAGAGGFSQLVATGVNNLQDEYLTPEESQPIREESFRQWETRRTGCLTCQVRCLHWYEMETEKFGKFAAEGLHANSVRGLASNLGVDNPEALLIMHRLCNEYSLDVDGVSAAVAFALECADHGILEREQPGGIILDWGNGESLVRLVEQIGERRGLGKLLGEGVYEAARCLGKGSENLAMTTKRVGINEGGLRSHRAWALGVIVSTRGGGHLGGSPQTENRRVSSEFGERLFGNPQAGVPSSYDGKGKLVAWTEGIKAVVDCLGLCYFIFGWYDLSFGNPEELAELLHLASGVEINGKELHRTGLRMHTLERYLNHRIAGFTRQDDSLPDRFYDVLVSSGPYEGQHLDRQMVERELSEYYAALGWDVETGNPTENTLASFGLDFLLGDQ